MVELERQVELGDLLLEVDGKFGAEMLEALEQLEAQELTFRRKQSVELDDLEAYLRASR